MVTVRIRGGLGNQLFTYAFGYTVAKQLGEKLILDLSDYKNGYFREYMLDKFNISEHDTTSMRYVNNKIGRLFNRIFLKYKYNYITENMLNNHPNAFYKRKRFYLYGYWQKEKHFIDFKKEISSQFEPLEFSENVQNFSNEICDNTSVAVHVRRGDYINNQWDISTEYYTNAINYIKKLIKNPVFYFFSDDIEWVKEKFGIDSSYRYDFYTDSSTDIDEFLCMTLCNHNIIANSTFSWWAAWLNKNTEKIIIAPKIAQWAGDYYPKDWILIDLESVNKNLP